MAFSKRVYAKRRARRVQAADNDLTESEWISLREAWNACAYCGKSGVPLQKDCIQPIAHGGRYTLNNVVPACRSCNASKCESEATAWMRRKKLDEKAFLARLTEIRQASGHASGQESGQAATPASGQAATQQTS